MSEKVGVAIVGLGGAVATTAVAGIEMIKAGSNDFSGLPLADRDIADMTAYRDLEFGGWDLAVLSIGPLGHSHGQMQISKETQDLAGTLRRHFGFECRDPKK